MRYRITVRGLGLELRGIMDQGLDEDQPSLAEFAKAMEPFGIVVASEATDDYDPFAVHPTVEQSLVSIAGMIQDNGVEDVQGLVMHMAGIHYMQAQVIQGERREKEAAQAELRDRELHHFETEQASERAEANVIRIRKERDRFWAMLGKIKDARSNHPDLPVCEKHPDEEDYVKCGWRSAVEDIDKVLAEVPE